MADESSVRDDERNRYYAEFEEINTVALKEKKATK